MSELMTAIPFEKLLNWAFSELESEKSIFGIHENKFYKNEKGTFVTLFGDKISSPIGPAAGPNSQLAQNIIASYLAGSRFIELKTVQKMDGEEIRKCISRPCINAEDECYNVEWSTELTVQEAFDEYVKGYFALHVLAKELGLAQKRDFVFNMSVGYDLDGIKLEKMDNYIEGMKNAENTPVWKECMAYLNDNLSKFKHVDKTFIDAIDKQVCSSITLSTLHGCPPQEIERIAKYLLDEKKLHTYVKCNPTILGYEFARKTCDEMGYDYLSFDDHHFNEDLQYSDAVAMFKGLMSFASDRNLTFGVKITNTFPVLIKRGELPGEEMYMSGRALFPLSINVAKKLSNDFDGKLPISYSGGADFFNVEQLFNVGICPITVATTTLKPGGYERVWQMASEVESLLNGGFKGIDVAKLNKLCDDLLTDEHYLKSSRVVDSRKIDLGLPLFDCFVAPCQGGGCPIEQQIPEYVKLVSEGKFEEAFQIIAIDNANPSITGQICNHNCQNKCTRLDYDSSVQIRNMKKHAVLNAQQNFIDKLIPSKIQTDKTVAIIGAGPAGISAALFLRRNGVNVTVFEHLSKPFGIVGTVIPEFRISSEAIKLDYDLAVKIGVRFIFGVRKEYDIKAVQKDYDFVILATGAWKEGNSPFAIPNNKAIDAIKFLTHSKATNCNVSLGKTVAIIGGGDVAMDCARAAKRAPGVSKVCIVYRRTVEFIPAEREEIELAKADGIEFLELLSPVEYDGKTLICEKMELSEVDKSGRRSVKQTGVKSEILFDTVINAVGANVETTLFEKNGVELDGRGKAVINEANETNLNNVYIAGDCKSGASTIVKAIADAKKIAINILEKINLPNDFVKVSLDFENVELYDKKGVLAAPVKTIAEGERCLRCDEICEICVDVCPNRANVQISVDGFENIHQIVHMDGMCNECGNCAVFCPYYGKPYKDKFTIFWSEEDFIDSTNTGALKLSESTFKIRNENKEILEHKLGGTNISAAMSTMLDAFLSNSVKR